MALRPFDKEGRSFSFLPQTRLLMVRRFRNPGGRGTCEVVYDDDGDVLLVDVDATAIPELRQAVGYVAGLYRLDQCDEDGNEIDGAPAAYVSIDAPRNATSATGTDPLSIVRDLAQTNAEVSKTFADKAAGMMEAVVECVRVVGGMPSKRLLANAALGVKPEPEEEDDADDEEDDRDDGDPESPAPASEPAPPGPSGVMWDAVAPVVAAMAPEIGKAIGDKVIELLLGFMKKPPAAAPVSTTTPVSAPASEPPPSGVDAGGAAAGPGADAPPPREPPPSAAPPTSEPPPPAPPPPTAAPPPPSQPASSTPTSPAPPPPSASAIPLARVAIPSRDVSTVPAAPIAPVRNALPTITPDQLQHFVAVRAALTPREQVLVDGVIRKLIERGDDATRMELVGELTSRTVEQGIEYVRAFIREAFGDRDAAERG